MKRYRHLQLLAVAVLLFELAAGFGGELTRQREFFPFTSWFLFVVVPNRANEYELLLRARGDRPIEPPRPFNQALGFVYQPGSIDTHELVQKFGRAVETHDDALVPILRRQVEAQFAVPAVRYDLILVTYVPVERWQTGRVLGSRVVHSYRSGQP